MAKIKKLSETQERTITSALTKVAELVHAGAAPDDAIVKIATEMQMPAGHIRLMANAYNTGRSVGTIKNGETLADKAAAFPLANAVDILERMFPSDVKTANDRHHATAISSDYDLSPHEISRAHESHRLVKAAEQYDPRAGLLGEERLEPYPGLPQKAGRRAVNKVRTLQKEAENKRLATTAASYGVIGRLNDLTNYFRQVGHVPLGLIKQNCVLVLGRRAAGLLDKVAEQRGKLAGNVAIGSAANHVVNWDAAPYNLVKQALDAITTFEQAKVDMDTFEKEAGAEAIETVRPFCPTEPRHVIRGSVWDRQSLTKSAVGIAPIAVGAAIGGGVRSLTESLGPDREGAIQRKLNALADPAHEDRLREIRTRTMMHDMMANDPVISGYQPDQVMEAFNRLSQVAPQALQQRIVAQQLMRKYLEQDSAVDPFELDQLLDVEKKLNQRGQPTALAPDAEPKRTNPHAGAA